MDDDLVVAGSIPVQTKHCDCMLELCLGSVTKVQEKMDVLVISAYPGDYSATPTSVIGALRRDLKIDVRKLARSHKEEDLRRLFSCWWTKPLEDKSLPYNRILCFEGSFNVSRGSPSTVSEVFRSLNALSKEEDIKVIMPLLAAGNQGYRDDLMLRLIVEAAIHWMMIGLPMKLLKLVLYTRKPHDPGKANLALVKYFEKLKKKFVKLWEENISDKQLTFKYDVYLSCCVADAAFGDMVKQALLQHNPKLRIYYERQELDKDKSWQEHIYEIIVTTAKVFTLLSPNFLEDSSCIEQYNMALCCTRNSNHSYLAPLYMEEVEQMPTYMGLIQYIDCRPVCVERILAACQMISFDVENDALQETQRHKSLKKMKTLSLDNSFDLFISYSHKETTIANQVFDVLRTLRPEWNVFIDHSGLHAGSAWQAKLYQSIECSKAVIALLSTNYLESKVCQEEYNLARAMHDDPSYPTTLIELKVATIDEWPAWCTPSHTIDLINVTEMELVKRIKDLLQMVDLSEGNSGRNNVWDKTLKKDVISIKEVSSIWRQEFRRQGFPFIQNVNFLDTVKLNEFKGNTKYDIVLSYHEDSNAIAQILIEKLKNFIPTLTIGEPVKNNRALRLHELDEGKIIIPLLCSQYVNSKELLEEFHTALCRHRMSNEVVFFPIIIDELQLHPVYPQLCFCLFSLTDYCWLMEDEEEVQACLQTAACFICNLLMKTPKVKTSFKTLLSMREIQLWYNYKAQHGEDTQSELFPWYFSTLTHSDEVITSAHQNSDVTSQPSEQGIEEQEALAPQSNNVMGEQETTPDISNNDSKSTSEENNIYEPKDVSSSEITKLNNNLSDNAADPKETDLTLEKEKIHFELKEEKANNNTSIKEKVTVDKTEEPRTKSNEEKTTSLTTIKRGKRKSNICSLG